MGVPRRRLLAAALILCGAATAAAPARAGDLDLEDDDDDKKSEPKKPEDDTAQLGLSPMPVATIRPHAYTLQECLALAERNHPNLWAARARLAAVHAQLDEAKYTPYSYWGASSRFGVVPQSTGSLFYNAVPRDLGTQGLVSGWGPFFQFGVSGTIPIYTFGKIDSIRRAAEANVRLNEWDVEQTRQNIRMDVRRAYFGLMLARDALYIADDVLRKINKGIEGVATKLEKGDTSVEEADRLRLEIYRDELNSRVAEAKKGEAFASAALRFLTGVQTAFEILDEPLKRPNVTLGPIVRYLTAARLFRGDVNRARAGVAARKAQVDFARANLFPNFGVGLRFDYGVAPGLVQSASGLLSDAGNYFTYVAAFGMDWPLDILPRNARVQFAEAQLEEARAIERLALGGVAVEVENAYAGAVEAKTREENWDRAEHRAKRWMSSVQDGIDLGTKDERYLIEPLRAYVFARANHVQALMDFNVALSELARVSGWDAAAPTM
jgi:outer membrane protein TolC